MTTQSKILCSRCAGTGLLHETDPSGGECWACRGTGWVKPETSSGIRTEGDESGLKCKSCGGSGLVDPRNPSGRKCRACHGTGWGRAAKEKNPRGFYSQTKCKTCGGTGLADGKDPSGSECEDCRGSGWQQADGSAAALAPVDVEVINPSPESSRIAQIFEVIEVRRNSQRRRDLPMVQRASAGRVATNIAVATILLASIVLLIVTFMHG